MGQQATSQASSSSPIWERLEAFVRAQIQCFIQTLVVESPFASARLRTSVAKRFKTVDSITAIIWKLLQVAEHTFRRLIASELLPAVYAGAKYVEGIKQSVS